MGLDSVEILVNVENAFGITISNYEAEKISTVGDIHNIVWRSLQGRQSMRCKSQQLFYKLRHILTTKFNVPKEAVDPEASLNEIFPITNRRLLYRKLQQEIQLKLPELILQNGWRRVLWIAGLLLIPGLLILSAVLVKAYNYTSWLYLLPGLGLIATIFFSNILDPMRTVFLPAMVNAYTRKVLSMNYASLMQDSRTNRKEVEMVINHIIADTAGVEVYEVSPEKSLTNDLGID